MKEYIFRIMEPQTLRQIQYLQAQPGPERDRLERELKLEMGEESEENLELEKELKKENLYGTYS